mmetsp:Transcript_24369/g.43732  ORF Transcript_24369/g.43732 Transcript_24369/m.43732 type:complete len:241 (+) Transcript_24369:101-823(+)
MRDCKSHFATRGFEARPSDGHSNRPTRPLQGVRRHLGSHAAADRSRRNVRAIRPIGTRRHHLHPKQEFLGGGAVNGQGVVFKIAVAIRQGEGGGRSLRRGGGGVRHGGRYWICRTVVSRETERAATRLRSSTEEPKPGSGEGAGQVLFADAGFCGRRGISAASATTRPSIRHCARPRRNGCLRPHPRENVDWIFASHILQRRRRRLLFLLLLLIISQQLPERLHSNRPILREPRRIRKGR